MGQCATVRLNVLKKTSLLVQMAERFRKEPDQTDSPRKEPDIQKDIEKAERFLGYIDRTSMSSGFQFHGHTISFSTGMSIGYVVITLVFTIVLPVWVQSHFM